jgi:hypothetical protein
LVNRRYNVRVLWLPVVAATLLDHPVDTVTTSSSPALIDAVTRQLGVATSWAVKSSATERWFTAIVSQSPGMANLPSFDELPAVPGQPQGNAWGLWGRDDELGSMYWNLTPRKRTEIKGQL